MGVSTTDIKRGNIGIITIQEWGNAETYIKKYVVENGRSLLRSLNKKYKDIDLSCFRNDEVRIVGKVLVKFTADDMERWNGKR